MEVMSLEKNRKKIRTPNEITQITRQIETLLEEIDQLVFELYGLTYKEVEIVKNKL